MRNHTQATAPRATLSGRILTAILATTMLPLLAGCASTTALHTDSSTGAYPLRRQPATTTAADSATAEKPVDAVKRHPGAYPLRA